MSGDVLDFLPAFPEVRCDNCKNRYIVGEPPQGGLINGFCPRCSHPKFSTSFDVRYTAGIEVGAADRTPE